MDGNNTIVHSSLEKGYDFFIVDKWGVKLHFKISSFIIPPWLLSEAIEVVEDNTDREARVYMVSSDFDSNIEEAEKRLKEKITKGVNKKYLEFSDGCYSIRNSSIKGRFLGDYFEVDGLRLSPDEFIKAIECYQGWNFSIKFHELSD